MLDKEYLICSSCILDNVNVPNLEVNKEGVCNYCVDYNTNYIQNELSISAKQEKLEEQLKLIKSNAKSNGYDCIMGLSGGVDSSYLAYLAKDWGLNPLLVHFDNGWNSELAVQNIENIIQYTGFDLFTC